LEFDVIGKIRIVMNRIRNLVYVCVYAYKSKCGFLKAAPGENKISDIRRIETNALVIQENSGKIPNILIRAIRPSVH